MNIVAITTTWKSEHKCSNEHVIVVERQVKTTITDEGHNNETLFLLTLRGSFLQDGERKKREYLRPLSSKEMQQIKTGSMNIDDVMRDRRYDFRHGTVFSSKVNDWL